MVLARPHPSRNAGLMNGDSGLAAVSGNFNVFSADRVYVRHSGGRVVSATSGRENRLRIVDLTMPVDTLFVGGLGSAQ